VESALLEIVQSAIVVVILENENVDEKYVVVRKIDKVVVSGSRGLQKTELQDLQLGVVM